MQPSKVFYTMPNIRPESPSDISAIHLLTKEAFLDAPHTNHTEEFIINELRQSGNLSISLVAEHDGKVIGHIAVSPVTISDGSLGWYGLGPISVSPQHQRQGIGSQLIRAALHRLEGIGASGCVLVGNPAYYGRFGFTHQDTLTYPGIPPEYFQAIYLSGSLAHGTVTCHKAFSAQH